MSSHPVHGRLFQHAHIPNSNQAHMEGSGNRSGRQRQHIHIFLHLLDFFLMRYSKPLFFTKKFSLESVKTYTLHYGFIVDGDSVIDEVLVSVMKAPKSYTAEDVAEINCHGGILILQKVMELLIKNGARVAEPGEFTKRAFLNGRMDLSEAEAVMDLIQSKNEFALQVCRNPATRCSRLQI